MPATILLEDLQRANDDELTEHLSGLFGPPTAPGGGFDPSNIIPQQIPVEAPAAPPEPEPPPQELQEHVAGLFSAPANSPPPAPAPAPAPTPTPMPAPSGNVIQQLADHVSQASGLKWIGEGITNLQQGAQQATTSGLTNLLPPAPPPAPTPAAPPTGPGPGAAPDLNAPQGPLVDYARQMATRAGIDPNVFVRQIQQESGFNPGARSPAGATGIAQFMPGTAQGMGIDPNDPYQALEGAARLMKSHLEQYGGDYAKALAAYNAGPGNVAKYGGVPPFEETQRYVRTILGGTSGQTAPTPAQGLERAGAALAGANRDISQFGDAQLTNSQAYAACGPAAAVRFAQRFGRNPTLKEAVDLASTVGWTEEGMAGLASEKALMDKMGVPTRMVTGAEWGTFANEARTGNPVTISTRGHYFTADGYDPKTNRFHVGRSGLDLKGGSEWMTPEQMTGLMGAVQGGLLADNPQAPTSTVQVAGVQSEPSAAPAARQGIQFLGDEGQTAAGFTAPGAAGKGLLEQAAGAVGEGFTRLGETVQGGLTILDNAIDASAATPNPTPAAVPGGGYDPSAFRAETTPPEPGIPLRQDVRDLGQQAQPTLLEPGGPVGELLGQIGEAPGLSEADRAARRQAIEETPVGQAYQSDIRKQLLPNITEPNHPINVLADLQEKYGALPREQDMTPEDRQRWRDAQVFIGGLTTGPKVDLAGLAGLRASARAAAAAAAETPAEPATLVDKAVAVGVNNMLGGTASMFNNAVSGVAENVYRPFKTAVIQGELGPAFQDLRAQGAAVGDALSDMATTFTSGKRLSDIGGADYPEAFPGKVGMLPFTSGNLRANAALDEGNRAVAMAGAMAAEMSRLLRDNPTLTQAEIRAQYGKELLDAGINAAKEATFEAGGTGIGDKVAAARRKLTDPTASVRDRMLAAASIVLVPFSKIPDVMLTRGAGGLPGLAEARAAAGVVRGSQTPGQALRQVGVTEAVNAAIAWQVVNGNITGNGPSDPDKKRVLQNARDADGNPIWQPNSLKVPTPFGSRWIPYSSLGPTAVRVGAIANLIEQLDESYRQPDQNYLDAFSKATGETITDAWYLQNIGRMFEAQKNGKLFDTAGNAVLDFGERYIPDSALAYQMRQYLDPVQRDPRNPLEDVANRVPFASQLVPPKINPATGQPTQAPRDVLSGLVRSPAPGQPDPTSEELARHNLGVAEASKTVTLPAVGKLPAATISITDDEQRRYQELTGQYIDSDVRAIRDLPDYKRLDKDQQRKVLQDIIADARKAAAKDIYTALGADELNARIDRYAELERARAEPSVRLTAPQP